MERWYFLIASIIFFTLLWLYQYKIYKDNRDKKKIKLSFKGGFFWRTHEFNQKDGRMFLELNLVIVTIAFVGFNFLVFLLCIGVLKPAYETSGGVVLELTEKNGQEYLNYEDHKNVKVIRVTKGDSCEGAVSDSNTINFCTGDLTCVKKPGSYLETPGTCQCEKGTSKGCKYDVFFDQVKQTLRQ